MVPFHSYAGTNSGIPVEPLTTAAFRSTADAFFGFSGSELMARTSPGWLEPSKVSGVLRFCTQVADAYKIALGKPGYAPI